jgi:hypothetical protein
MDELKSAIKQEVTSSVESSWDTRSWTIQTQKKKLQWKNEEGRLKLTADVITLPI